MTDRLSDVPSFIVDGFTWSCYVTDDGHRYEWRSPGFRGRVWRHRAIWYGSLDGKAVGTFDTPEQAMRAASLAAQRRRAA